MIVAMVHLEGTVSSFLFLGPSYNCLLTRKSRRKK